MYIVFITCLKTVKVFLMKFKLKFLEHSKGLPESQQWGTIGMWWFGGSWEGLLSNVLLRIETSGIIVTSCRAFSMTSTLSIFSCNNSDITKLFQLSLHLMVTEKQELLKLWSSWWFRMPVVYGQVETADWVNGKYLAIGLRSRERRRHSQKETRS